MTYLMCLEENGWICFTRTLTSHSPYLNVTPILILPINPWCVIANRVPLYSLLVRIFDCTYTHTLVMFFTPFLPHRTLISALRIMRTSLWWVWSSLPLQLLFNVRLKLIINILESNLLLFRSLNWRKILILIVCLFMLHLCFCVFSIVAVDAHMVVSGQNRRVWCWERFDVCVA